MADTKPILQATCTECSRVFVADRRTAKRCSEECRRMYRIRRVMATRDPVKHNETQKAYYRNHRAEKAAYDQARKPFVNERRKAQHRARYERLRDDFLARAYRRRDIYRESSVTADDVRRVFAKRHGSCCYCGSQTQPELEHVLPISRGGRHCLGNLEVACRICNRQKNNKTVMEWRIWRRRLGLDDLQSLTVL